MSDKQVVAELKASAEAALSRGFAILTCEPHDKSPWAKYSPHAVNSSTRDPLVALRAWNDGEEANFGVGCGPSNITVVDVDHGINNIEEFQAWKKEHGIPDTFTVMSGREGFGAHMYFSGAVPTVGFKIGNATGELKGIGGYVVGAGSIHPSGKKYVVIDDADIVPLPEGLTQFAKDKSKMNFPKIINGKKELIPISTRWIHLQSRAGSFRNQGLSEEGIYAALKDFAANNCEDGANYPDEKIKNLATWAAGEKVEESQDTVVVIGAPDPESDNKIPEIPLETITGDYVGDLSLAITSGTFIPPVFARSSLKALLGAVMDGCVAFPGEETLHMRHWNAIISTRPEAGKSEVWKRILLLLGKKIIQDFSIVLPTSGFFSSGEHAIRTLAENDNRKHLAYFDEMRALFEKGGSMGSTLFSKLLELYENTAGGVGSVTNGKSSFSNVSLSMTGNFTLDSFENAVSGKGAGGSGFLSRMTLSYSNGIDYAGDWDALNPDIINPAVTGIIKCLKFLEETSSKLKDSTQEGYTGLPWIPAEEPDAKSLRFNFQTWLKEQKTQIEKDMPGSSYAMRLESHFKRDLLMRAVFQPEGQRVITREMVEKSIAWAKHELMLRMRLWPVDGGNDVVLAERRIINAINKQGPLTKAGVQKFSNAEKASGGYDAWNKAWANVLKADRVVQLGVKSDKGKIKFGFENAVWNRAKREWIKD